MIRMTVCKTAAIIKFGSWQVERYYHFPPSIYSSNLILYKSSHFYALVPQLPVGARLKRVS